jgi:hypothetical protein
MKNKSILLGPTFNETCNFLFFKFKVKLEYSIHQCPKLLFRELNKIFPEEKLNVENLLVIPTFQQVVRNIKLKSV